MHYTDFVESQPHGNWILTKRMQNLELIMTAAAYFKPQPHSILAASKQEFLGPKPIGIKNKVS